MADAALYASADRLFLRKRLLAFGLPAVVLAYLAYVFFAFDIAGLAERARMDNARTLLADVWSYKTHVTQDNRTGEVVVAIEGERKGTYAPGTEPDWVEMDPEGTVVELGDGHAVTFLPAGGFRYDVPGYGPVEVRVEGREVVSP